MPALIPTEYAARVEWIGVNPDRDAMLRTASLDKAFLAFGGIGSESRGGTTRPSCSRVISQYPRGTKIRNARELSVICMDELAIIAQNMGIDAIDPAHIGASVALRGIPDFSHIPPGSRLINDAGASMVIDMQNRPCHLPVAELKPHHGDAAKGFKAAAKGLRGVTAAVEAEGMLYLGDELRLHIPDQRAWHPESDA